MRGLRGWDVARLVLCVAGVAVACYLTLLHYVAAVPLVCPASGIVDCAVVLTSRQSAWLGIPVAAFGILWFVVAGILAGLSLRCTGDGEPAALRRAGLAWSVVGAIAVVYFVYAELVLIGKICIWCSTAHVLVLALFVISVITDAARQPDPA